MKKAVGGLLALVLAGTQSLFGYSVEKNYWAQKRRFNAEISFREKKSQNILLPAFSKCDRPEMSWVTSVVGPNGEIRSAHWAGPAAPLIVHIQDIHDVEEAQRNISGIVRAMLESGRIALVGIEGGVGSVGLSGFQQLPDPSVVRAGLDVGLQLGYIGGAELAAFDFPKADLFGVEDPSVYVDHLAAFERSRLFEERDLKNLATLASAAEKISERVYSPGLKEFEFHRVAYDRGEQTLSEWLRYLWPRRPERSAYKELEKFQELTVREERLNIDAVRQQLVLWIRDISGTLSPDRLKRLNELCTQIPKQTGVPISFLHSLEALSQGKKVSIRDFPALFEYRRCAEKSDELDHGVLLSELNALERAVEQRLATEPAERAVSKARRDLRLLSKLVQHKLTPAEWSLYQSRPPSLESIQTVLGQSGPGNHGPDLKGRKAYEDFSRFALKRNDTLSNRLLDRMAATRNETAILVAGGFHTEGLMSLWRKAGVSYVVVGPRLSHPVENVHVLDGLVRSPLALEKILAGEQSYLAAPRLGTHWGHWLDGVPAVRKRVFQSRHAMSRLVVGFMAVKHAQISDRVLDWTIFDPLRADGFYPQGFSQKTVRKGNLAVLEVDDFFDMDDDGQRDRRAKYFLVAAQKASLDTNPNVFSSAGFNGEPVTEQTITVENEIFVLRLYSRQEAVGGETISEFVHRQYVAVSDLVRSLPEILGIGLEEIDQTLSSRPSPDTLSPPRWGRGSAHPGDAVVIGDADAFLPSVKKIFRAEGLFDLNGRWSGGSRIVVQVGDVVGRGPHPLDLYRYLFDLQAQARRAGGDVILLAGNHEMALIMNRPIGGDFKPDQMGTQEELRTLLIQQMKDGNLKCATVLLGPGGEPRLVTHAGYSTKLKQALRGTSVWPDWVEEQSDLPKDPSSDPMTLERFFNEAGRKIANFTLENPGKPVQTAGDLRQYLNYNNGLLMGNEGVLNRAAKYVDDGFVGAFCQIVGHSVGSAVRFQDMGMRVINTDSGLFRLGDNGPLNPVYLRLTMSGEPQMVEVGRYGEKRVYGLPRGDESPQPDNFWANLVDIKDRITLQAAPLYWLNLNIRHANTVDDIVLVYERFYRVLGRGLFPWTRRARPALWGESQKLLVETLRDQRASWLALGLADGEENWEAIDTHEGRLDGLLIQAQEVWKRLPFASRREFLPAFLASWGWAPEVLDSQTKEKLGSNGGPMGIHVRPTAFAGINEILVEVKEDGVGLLSLITGVVAAHGFHVLAGDVRVVEGKVLARLAVHGMAEEASDKADEQASMEQNLTALLEGEMEVEDVFRQTGRPYSFKRPNRFLSPPTVVGFHNGSLKILTSDRDQPGLLHVIARKLADMGCNISLAPNSIRTQGDTVLDFFKVSEPDGSELSAPRKIDVANGLTNLLNQPEISAADFSDESPLPEPAGDGEKWVMKILKYLPKLWSISPFQGPQIIDLELSGQIPRPTIGGAPGHVSVGRLGMAPRFDTLARGASNSEKKMLARAFGEKPEGDVSMESFGQWIGGQARQYDGEDDHVSRLVEVALKEYVADESQFILFAKGFNENLYEADQIISTTLQQQRAIAFELTETLLAGELTPQDQMRLAQLESLASRVSVSPGNTQVNWIVPDNSEGLDAFFARHPSLVALSKINANAIEKKRVREGDGKLSVKQLLLMAQNKTNVEDLSPTDVYLSDRSEWSVEDDLPQGVVRLLVTLLGGLVFDATRAFEFDLRRLFYLKTNA